MGESEIFQVIRGDDCKDFSSFPRLIKAGTGWMWNVQ